jgi:hypothetical protein
MNNIPKHALWLQQGTKVILPKTLCPEYKALFGANPTQHINEYHSSYLQELWWLHHVMGMLFISKGLGSFWGIKRNRIKILEETLV